MSPNPYEATLVEERPPPPRKTFSWITFLIVLLVGQFLYTWFVMDRLIEDPAYVSSAMTARTLIIALGAMAAGKLAARF